MANSRCSLLLLLCALVALTRVEAQSVAPSPADACAVLFQELTPCLDFAAGVVPDPPATCCKGLKDVVEKDVDCLCEILRNPDTFKINITLALQLPARCGVAVSPATCFPVVAPSPAPPSSPPATSPQAPATSPPSPATSPPRPAIPPQAPPTPLPPATPPPRPVPAALSPSPGPSTSAASCLKAIQFGFLTIMATISLL